jgi:hypothetical protein
VWRLARNVLPTRIRLQDKKVNCPTHCVLCNLDEENVHLFFTCPSSINVWNMSELGTTISTLLNRGLDCSGMIFNSLQMLSNSEASLFACVLWSI